MFYAGKNYNGWNPEWRRKQEAFSKLTRSNKEAYS
jgi:hypothetical protein